MTNISVISILLAQMHFESIIYLADAHRAQYVEKNEGAFGVIVARQISVRKTLDPTDWQERKFCYDSSIKDAIEHTQKCSKGKTNSKH